MGDMQRKTSCGDCHIEIEKVHAESIDRNLTFPACHVNEAEDINYRLGKRILEINLIPLKKLLIPLEKQEAVRVVIEKGRLPYPLGSMKIHKVQNISKVDTK